MLSTLFIGFTGGLITGISPCILPVLPLVLAVSGGSRWRPWQVVGGLVTSPPTTCHGRHREPPLTARISGKTGKMQGEMPVIRPPVNPMNSVDSMLCSFVWCAVWVCN